MDTVNPNPPLSEVINRPVLIVPDDGSRWRIIGRVVGYDDLGRMVIQQFPTPAHDVWSGIVDPGPLPV